MKFIKDWIGIKSEDDNIPEIKLQKNEPIVHYDPKLKRYIIEGETYEEPKAFALPPKYKKPIGSNTSELKEKEESKRISRRYYDILDKQGIITPDPKQSIEDNPAKVKSTKDEEEEEKAQEREARIREIEREMELEKEKQREREREGEKEASKDKDKDKDKDTDNEDNKQNKDNEQDKDDKDKVNENTNEEPNKKDKDKEFENEVQMSEIEHKEDGESSFAVRDYYYQNVEIEKLKSEYKSKMLEMQSEYQDEIKQLKESVQFYEEDNEESTKLLKNQITDFINENLELKMNYEKTKDELAFKQKEIEQYQNLFEYYRKLVDENSSSPGQSQSQNNNEANDEKSPKSLIDKMNNNFHTNSNQLGSDYVYINSKIEKLETEKIILNNDLIELKSENESIKLEKDYLFRKTSALEGQNNKVKFDLNQKESSFQELHLNYKSLNHIKEDLEKKVMVLKQEAQSNMSEITDKKHLIASLQKNNAENSKRIIQLSNQVDVYMDKNEKLNKELRSISEHYNQTADYYTKENNALLMQIETDRNEYEDVIERLAFEKENMKVDLDDCVMQLNKASHSLSKVDEWKRKEFELEKGIEELKEKMSRVKLFIKQQGIKYPNMAHVLKLNDSYKDDNDDNNNNSNTIGTFDKDISDVIMNMITMNTTMSNYINELTIKESIANTEKDNIKTELKLIKAKMAQDAQKSHKLLYKTINDSNVAIASLKNINSRLVPKTFKDDYHTILHQYNDLKTHSDVVMKENEELKLKVTTLMQMLQESKDEYENQIEQITTTLTNEKQLLQSQLEEKDLLHNQSIQRLIIDKENEIKTLQKEQESLIGKHSLSSSENEAMKEKINELMTILSSMQKESESDVQSQSQLRDDYENKIAKLNESINILNGALKEEKQRKASLEASMHNLNEEISKVNKSNNELKESNEKIRKDYMTINSAYVSAKEEGVKKDEEKETLIEEHSDIMAKMENDNRKLEQKLAETIILLKEYDKEMKDDYANTDGVSENIKKEVVREDKGIQYGEEDKEKDIKDNKPNEVNKKAETMEDKGKEGNDQVIETIVKEEDNSGPQQQQQQQQPLTKSQSQKLGFLGRLMAPLFLTEKEIETLKN